jgi:putative lipase involved disintegration of autophagic bodies
VQTLTALYRDANIWVTGFSLGGALGVLAALDIKEIFGKVNQFYSFGMPRVGN